MTFTTNLSSIVSRLETANRNLPENLNQLKKQVTLEIQEVLVKVTPVKTGHARTNWRVYNNLENPQPLPIPTSVETAENNALTQGRHAVNQARAGQPLYIINSVRHISALNIGWSVQAPANFVRIAISAAIHSINTRTIRIVELD